MHTNTLFLMLFVSLILGLVGLLIFLWGLKGKQFSDEKKDVGVAFIRWTR
ncbi:Thioredoxin reductase [Helicobacter bizzozeronii CCUG 35545]|nr:Thioredoxin reductase [Helicobacter bizzozeronii CCUG 35545]